MEPVTSGSRPVKNDDLEGPQYGTFAYVASNTIERERNRARFGVNASWICWAGGAMGVHRKSSAMRSSTLRLEGDAILIEFSANVKIVKTKTRKKTTSEEG